MDETPKPRTFFGGLFRDLLHSFGVLLAAFLIGSGGTAAVCWYYGLPIALGLIGGLLVLAFMIFVMTAEPFS